MKKLLLSVLMVLLALPAFAFNIYNTPEGDKVDIYGSVRMLAGYQNSEAYTAGAFQPKANKMLYAMYGNSRFGVNFKLGGFFGMAELNFTMDGQTANPTGFGFRELFAGYDFGNGHKLTFGQKTTLSATSAAFADFFFVDNGLAGFGALTGIRRPTLIYSYKFFDFGVVASPVPTPAGITGASKLDMPRFEVSFNLPMGSKVAASYALFNYKDGTKFNVVNAFHVVGLVRPKFGNNSISATAFYAMNGGMYGMVRSMAAGGAMDGTNASILPTLGADGKVQDVHSWGVALQYGYKFTDMVSLIVGGGFQMNMSKKYKSADDKNHDLNAYAVFAQVPFQLNKYIKIAPGVGYYNNYYSNYKKEQRDEIGTLMAGVYLFAGF